MNVVTFGQIVPNSRVGPNPRRLFLPGGTVKRDVFVDAFPVIAREGRLAR